MKIKVAEAKGKPLDWAVGMALDPGHAKTLWRLMKNGKWNPSTDWSQGGPIIERECIGTWPPDEDHPHWTAGKQGVPKATNGPTPLIAAMRCFCCSKLGDEADIPEELCQQQNS